MNGWIKVSEKRPSEEDYYLVTIETTYLNEPRYEDFKRSVCIKHTSVWKEIENYGEVVIAWMPLPEPYNA